jgi:ATP-dependent exoDNAse (exonuclease V) alpha subunit
MALTLTPHQQTALQKLQAFTQDENARAFVLRGYAGTGKTTLLGQYADWLEAQGMKPVLLATTGRAAKVLAGKTGREASTIHSCVYQFDELGEGGEKGTQLALQFDIRPQPVFNEPPVYIVDEASMIPNTATTGGQVATFGSGHLLVDFLEFTKGRRVVFVGDPCQLPPVSEETFSPALSPRYLRDNYKVAVQYAELSEIIRQGADSEILRLAGRFRADIIANRYVKWPKVMVPSGLQAHLYPNEHELVQAYLKHLRKKDYSRALMITNANGHCRRLNHKLRMTLMGNKNLAEGELLMVVQNSYYVPLTNGDQVIVRKVRPAGRQAGFGFLEVELEDIGGNNRYKTLMIRELLYNNYAGLQPEESRSLLIDFDKRMRKKGVKRKTEAYQKAMRNDPYLNALRAKFGYVITCHKAQGGEWPEVYLNVQKSVFVQQRNALYRWFYTALTRASDNLYLNDNFWIEGFNKRQPRVAAQQFKKIQRRNRK